MVYARNTPKINHDVHLEADIKINSPKINRPTMLENAIQDELNNDLLIGN